MQEKAITLALKAIDDHCQFQVFVCVSVIGGGVYADYLMKEINQLFFSSFAKDFCIVCCGAVL